MCLISYRLSYVIYHIPYISYIIYHMSYIILHLPQIIYYTAHITYLISHITYHIPHISLFQGCVGLGSVMYASRKLHGTQNHTRCCHARYLAGTRISIYLVMAGRCRSLLYDRPSSSMWCPDGIGQGWLGVGIAGGSEKKRFPPKRGRRKVCVELLSEESGSSRD